MPGLLDRAIQAHGGAQRFESASEVVTRLRCGGAAFAMRFQRGALAGFEGRLSTSEQPHAVLSPYSAPDRRGVLVGDEVRIESEGGEVLERRAHPRDAFRKLRRNLWWDDLDLLYFAGYALWNYVSTPFMLARPGFETEEAGPWEENGERWERLRVRFPDHVPTHSREQVFYFDQSGLLRRLDYTAEVFGSWAKAAHYCHGHREFSGLIVPTRRKVFPRRRNGRPRPFPTLVWIEIDDVSLVGPA